MNKDNKRFWDEDNIKQGVAWDIFISRTVK